MDTDNPRVVQMVDAVREYCELIDHIDLHDCGTCLGRMAQVLPRLHAAVVALPSVDSHTGVSAPEFETRFELFSRLRRALGDRDGYWLEYDQGQQEMSGSLADDFTDIYFDLRHGLDLIRAHPDQLPKALASWKSSFQLHWGQHLVDAERQVYVLCNRRDEGCAPDG